MVSSYFFNACELETTCLDGTAGVVGQPEPYTFGSAPRTLSKVHQPSCLRIGQFPATSFAADDWNEG